jgi:dihydrofolate reductase
MIVSFVVAVGNDNQIGLDNDLPWRLKSDLKRFKEITLNHYVLMGMNTFMSLPVVLKDRNIIVLSKSYFTDFENVDSKNYTKEQEQLSLKIQKFKKHVPVKFVENIDNCLAYLNEVQCDELMVIGGAQIFNLFQDKDLVNKVYLTKVNYSGKADVFFPEMNFSNWKVIEKNNFYKDQNNDFDYEYITYTK